MFGKKRETNTVVSEPEPMAVEPELNDIERAEYQRVTEFLGISPSVFFEDRLFHFLRQEGRKVYDYDQVYAYLNSKFGKEIFYTARYVRDHVRQRTWTWRSLRATGFALYPQESESAHHSKNGETFLYDPYTEKVPLAVLLLVESMSKAVPDAQFFVSDFIRESDRFQADPFLMVTDRSAAKKYIVEKWDEPSFK